MPANMSTAEIPVAAAYKIHVQNESITEGTKYSPAIINNPAAIKLRRILERVRLRLLVTRYREL